MKVSMEEVLCPLCGSDEAHPVLEWRNRRMFRCRGCSLLYRNPRPTASNVRGGYAVERTTLEWEERVWDRRTHQFRRFLDLFPDRPGLLLDIGCSTGSFLKMAQERGWETVGVDLNPKAIASAKERFRVNALLGDLRDACFPDASFDLVTLGNVLDHTPDPLDVLLEIHRVLKEDGCVFIRTPNAVCLYLSFRLANFVRQLRWRKVIDESSYSIFFFHLTNFSRLTVRLLLDRSGFIPLSIRNSPPIPGDPYLGLGSTGELLVALGKRAVHGVAQGLALLSRGRWLIGPSLEAWGKRGRIHEIA